MILANVITSQRSKIIAAWNHGMRNELAEAGVVEVYTRIVALYVTSVVIKNPAY